MAVLPRVAGGAGYADWPMENEPDELPTLTAVVIDPAGRIAAEIDHFKLTTRVKAWNP